MSLKLYSYFRSSSSYRVRIALNLKGLDFQYLPVHLLHGGGEQFAGAFLAVNAQSLVPVVVDEGRALTQSLAIIEYLEETRPAAPLLPKAPGHRAYVRQIALAIACDIQPLGNLRVLEHLGKALGQSDAARRAWAGHWITRGFGALEAQLVDSPLRGTYCYGDSPTMADCCLVPQMYNAVRFGVDLTAYPTLRAIDAACRALPAFERAHPDRQPDAG